MNYDIAILPKQYDVWISYSWSETCSHGVSGHIYEIVDYYFILKDELNIGIAFFDDMTVDVFRQCIIDKYDFTEDEIEHIISNTYFYNKPSKVYCKNILLVDGGTISIEKIIARNIIMFACGDMRLQDHMDNRVTVLQDFRVYGSLCKNSIDYKKKILFDKLIPYDEESDAYLIYATKNCRYMEIADILDLKDKYGKDSKYILISTEPEKYTDIQNVESVKPPVKELFNRFGTYVYTPVGKKMDCSPRFIAECKYLGKNVEYYNIDYWDIDRGLYWRVWDINNDWNSIFLTKDDTILGILNEIIR